MHITYKNKGAQRTKMNVQNHNQAQVKLSVASFPLELIYAAANALKNDAVFIFDQAGKEYAITVIAKDFSEHSNIQENFGQKLQELLLIRKQAEQNQELKKGIIRQALMRESAHSSIQEVGFEDKNLDDLEASLLEFEQESLEDPLGISTPWHEQGK
jgi:hypothetical protein